MNTFTAELLEKVATGSAISEADALQILQAQGSGFTWLMAGAQQLKETHCGTAVDLCSIINAKSGRCAENCAFCAQSAHHQSQTEVYPLKSVAEIVAGARQA
ncbi:MAG: biotin synthase BioB, partial [Desulfuromonas sp.]